MVRHDRNGLKLHRVPTLFAAIVDPCKAAGIKTTCVISMGEKYDG